LFAVEPEVVAHDLHPDYRSTAYALQREGVELVGVQHHHAHLAACLAEYGLSDTVAVGAVFDGTGYGLDGSVWGGELLSGDVAEVERDGHLWPVRMPGATAAIRQPWRMAFAWLAEAFGQPCPLPLALRDRVEPGRWLAMAQVAASPAVSPVTTSAGRLFDALGALCGLTVESSYEGQAAVELEAAAWRAGSAGAYEVRAYEEPRQGWILDPRPAIRAAAGELEGGVGCDIVAARFHAGLGSATIAAVRALAEQRGAELAVLSGGVFQNRLLLACVADGLTKAGLRVLVPERLPPNDGGIAFGQAAVAAARAPV
jgi:hydrogenase maturation protein HypF